MHYVATLRDQLEQLSQEKTPQVQGLTPRVTNANNIKVNEDDTPNLTSPQLRRRIVSTSSKEQSYDLFVADTSSIPIKLDSAAQAHIDKQRKLQEDLTVRQLKETSQAISRSVQNTDKILDSTEEAIEQSLATTGHATTRATKIYSQSSKTSCFHWLLIFAMTCVFIMVVLLIRVT